MAVPGLKSDILKVRLGEDTRRMVLYNTLISYDDLVLMLQRVFDGKLRSSDEVTLKYQDEDGDLITIADASDFAHAREYSPNGMVKMVVFINGRDVRSNFYSYQTVSIRKELAEVRDRVNSLVDMLDNSRLEQQVQVQEERGGADVRNEPAYPPPVSSEATSMFDPLKSSSDAPQPVQNTSTATSIATTFTTGTSPVSMSTIPSSSTSTIPTVVPSSQPSASRMFPDQSGSQFPDPTSQPPPSAIAPSPQPKSIATAPPPSSNYSPSPSTGYTHTPPQSGYPPPQTTQPSYPGYPNQSGSVATAPRFPATTTYPQPQAAAYAQYGATNTYAPQAGGFAPPAQSQQRFPQPYGHPYKMGYN